VLGIEIADVDAWNRLRNRAAHGRLLMDGDSKIDMQKHLNALNRVENIVNKLLLNAMQYEGKYYDHADRQVKQFTCVPLTMS
ncbi:MAG: hypothetical protein K8R46_09665, partial [Pirellulales bacterium]|nr:hypothetical protein [Pirellulales bacterium]